MRYHEEPPDIWTNYYGKVYRCDHPVYRVSTLYMERDKGLCVIQQRYNEETTATYLRSGFKEYFDAHAKKKDSHGYFPTVTVRQLMWALRMKPLKKERWETSFDHVPI